MFRLSMVDHVRLNFGHAVQNYTVHAQAADRLAGRTTKVRLGVLFLLGLATAAVCVSLLATPSRPYQIAAAIAAAVAFFGYALYLAVGVESRVFAHRSCAHRLWMVCERYRALLAEVQDGLLDRESIIRRRDELIAQMHSVYEQAFHVDQPAYDRLRQPAQGSDHPGLSDSEIDQFLPPSLRASAKPESSDATVSH